LEHFQQKFAKKNISNTLQKFVQNPPSVHAPCQACTSVWSMITLNKLVHLIIST